MNHHEREYFISRIRSGYHVVKYHSLEIKVYGPTIEDELEANAAYLKVYQECVDNGIPTEADMLNRLVDQEVWTADKEHKLKALPTDIERCQVGIYENRFNNDMKEQIRRGLNAGKKQLLDLHNQKATYKEHTCEGQALLAKSISLISNCSYVGKEKFDFGMRDVKTVWFMYCHELLDEKIIRQLSRSEPWTTTWYLVKDGLSKLFTDNDRELNSDQRNLIIWSKTYDNINESPEAPATDVLEDDDMLDGWFILQKRKRERERLEAELDSNPNTANANEVFIMVKDQQGADRVNQMNDPNAKRIKSERMQVIQDKGVVNQHDFPDERLKIVREQHEQYKGKFNNG